MKAEVTRVSESVSEAVDDSENVRESEGKLDDNDISEELG